MEKQNIIDGIRLIVIIGVFIFMVIGSYRNIINQNKVTSTNTYIDKDNEIVNSNLEKEEVTNIEEKISDTDNKEYKEISKDDINEYDSITINNIQNENTYTDLINEVYEITNNYRSLVGVSSLTLDSSLVEAASIRAKELSDSFSHTRPNGSSCFTVLSELGISYGTAGENIAAGYSSSQSVMEGWRSSSGHYQNIISSKFKKIGIGVAMVAAFLVGNQAKAAETTTLRVISTTDLHNQVSSEDYDIAGKNAGHSLAKLSTMIKAARAELNQGASLTVDAGDSVYGYGAEVLMGDVKKPSNTLQPIFEAMSKIGYDAITLGNHEFDYGYDFIKNQLTQSGLNDKCVVANVKEYATGNYPWKRTMMLTKNMPFYGTSLYRLP